LAQVPSHTSSNSSTQHPPLWSFFKFSEISMVLGKPRLYGWPGFQSSLVLSAAAAVTKLHVSASTHRGVQRRFSNNSCSFVLGTKTNVPRSAEKEASIVRGCLPDLEQRAMSQSTTTGLGAASIAAGLLAISNHLTRLPERRHRRRSVRCAGNDFAGSFQQQLGRARGGSNRVAAKAESNEDIILNLLGNPAKVVEERSQGLRNGLNNLRAAPQELGRKVSQPFVKTATAVSDSANAVAETFSRAQDGKTVETVQGSVGNIAAIPAVLKSRLVDAPIAAAQNAQDAVGKILGVPAKLISTTQDSVRVAEKLVGGVVALPGRLKDRVDGTVSNVQRASSAVAALPGQVSNSIGSKVLGVQNAATGFAQSTEAVIRLPGQAVAGIKETIEDAGQKVDTLTSEVGTVAAGFSNAIDGVGKSPSQEQEKAPKVANDASIPSTPLEPLGDTSGFVKSRTDSAGKAATPSSSQEPERGSKQ